jgi:DNA-binding transcriptional LysR family regulator
MDRLEAMTIVLLAVEKGSLTAAAKALNMPLPTVSRKVSELEAYLGTKLLQRSTRKLTLTDAGQNYVGAVKRIMGDIDEAERAASGEYTPPRGELVLTAPLLFGQMYLLPIVTDFLAAYPEINVRLLLSDRNLHLLDGHIGLRLTGSAGDLRDAEASRRLAGAPLNAIQKARRALDTDGTQPTIGEAPCHDGLIARAPPAFQP